MIRMMPTLAKTVLLAAVCCSLVRAQAMPHTILNIEVQNIVVYVDDVADVSTYATKPNVIAAATPRNFGESILIGDIVSVNGQPAKGVTVHNLRTITLRTATTPGQAIADVMRSNTQAGNFEILRTDGTAVGSIMFSGLGGAGPAPPGAPLAVSQGNNPIVGGTGAYLGVRGQSGQAVTSQTIANRQASMTEDPANRRQNGGGRNFFVLDIIPQSIPEVVSTANGPAITHSSDFSLVTPSKPAAAGEVLSVFMRNLGPTTPGVDPGKPFPASPPTVNAPVQVTVNGESAEVTAAVGYPGSIDGYQVNFRVPSGASKGTATIQVSAAWIAGPAVSIAIQ
jgi:uncharacterized protein (TIGR03437 family)